MPNKNIMELRAIPDLLGGKYYIPEYQRGFRWESTQITRLLDDLEIYAKGGTKGGFYCLQPIVVKVCPADKAPGGEKGWYEVIDGQQRLTTIRILCAIFDSLNNMPGHHAFDIHYETRPDMGAIFDTLEAPYNRATRQFEFIKQGREWNNLDAVFIYKAAQTVVEWFNADPSGARKNTFGGFFFNDREPDPNDPAKKSVQVVWYEDCGEKDARDLFNEINDLTVRLSCSELIRSLFLSSNTKYHSPLEAKLSGEREEIRVKLIAQDRDNWQRYVNTRWDEIEHRMSDPKVQAFITNRDKTKLCQIRNKIELLFDIIAKKHVGKEAEKKDPLHTFLYFNEMMEQHDASWMWNRVEQAFSRICGWMEDRDFFHKIGYLNTIGNGDQTICMLLEYADKHPHSEVMGEVDRQIKESVKGKRLSQLKDLDYNKDYDYIRRLLFLYNVELNRQLKSCENFEFDQFKPLGDWTLEHIHAQNSECLPHDDRKTWSSWASENASILRSIATEDEKNKKLAEKLERAAEGFERKERSYTHETVKELFDEVVEFYRNLSGHKGEVEPEHELSNMTLLNIGVNASIGCSAFAVKRRNIIERRNKGEYFPIGTLKVFNKAYSDNQHLYEWSYRDDREQYFNSIYETLKPWLANQE